MAKRTLFKWTILRPGGLRDEPGTGKACVGRTHLTPGIPVSRGFLTVALASIRVPLESRRRKGTSVIG